MKKVLLWGALALVVGLVALFWRDGLDLYRLVTFMDTSTEARDLDEGPWPRLTEVCVGCHGRQGNPLNENYPALAGQPQAYLEAQLQRFASGQRASATMAPLAMALSEAEVEFLAAYYARQTAVENAYLKPDPALQEAGQTLAASGACAACHGEGLMGHDQFPRLAGQGKRYLLTQLNAFATGERVDPTGAMTAVVSRLSEQDRAALAEYLSALSPVAR